MDLKNGQIKVSEILRNPKAMALFRQEFPQAANSPMLAMAGNMSLQQILNMAKGQMDQGRIQALMQKLEAV